ncbi:MAG: 3-phosphoshikimate 1-carboxyvinyltransferase [Firmicutes bacterium]|nr:3-phosphoshikimate 1-carboxyvinyltransferase [Bacillota bacterium]
MDIFIPPLKKFNRDIVAPPDKSITHRAILFSAFSEGNVKISNALLGEDCLSTIDCVRKLGAKVDIDGDTVTVTGTSNPQSADLYVGNSGTTLRLLAGLLARQTGKTFTLDGDASIRKRPMNRVIEPLTMMGAKISGVDGKAPLKIEGTQLHGIHYQSPVASAQVKSAILLAGLSADGETSVTEPVQSRDHTERMLRYFGVSCQGDGPIDHASVVNGSVPLTTPVTAVVRSSVLTPRDVSVPGDISSAAFPLVLAAGIKGGRVTVRDVGVNPTRDGILRVFQQCGTQFRLFNLREEFEPVADIELESAPLKPFHITREFVPLLIDEIPVLAVLACMIEGESVITGAEELKVKESNRIDTVVDNLKKMGADIEARPDGMVIRGKGYLAGGAEIDPQGDHRIAMSMAVAGALSQNGALIKNAECADVSYPGFWELFRE